LPTSTSLRKAAQRLMLGKHWRIFKIKFSAGPVSVKVRADS
jgi:hypothetical protein